MKRNILFGAAAAAALALTACSDPSFSVKGEISDGEGKTVLLEKADHAGIWMPIDSAKLKSNGKFSFSAPAPAAPEIYRISLDGNYIYFPVDSIEDIRIDAPAPRFATDFSISGSDNATALGKFEKELIAFAPKLAIPDSADAFKRRVFTAYLQEAKGSVVSYYILTKTINGRPLFDSTDDNKYIAAVATSFRNFRPDDPCTALLESAAKEGRRRAASAAGKKTVITAAEMNYPPVTLPDENGKPASLADVAGQGLPTVLIFADLSDPETRAINSDLQKLVASGKINVYSVGLDADQLTWRNAARNLPFTTVYANVSDARDVVAAYNVSSLPTIFLIDASGNLKARCAGIADLQSRL